MTKRVPEFDRPVSITASSPLGSVLSCAAPGLRAQVGLGSRRHLWLRAWDGDHTRELSTDLGAESVRLMFGQADAIDVTGLATVDEDEGMLIQSYAEAAAFLGYALESLPNTGVEDLAFRDEVAARIHALADQCRRSS